MTGALRVLVVCPMGLEYSGLAMAVPRYTEALHCAGIEAHGYVVSDEQHPEHGDACVLADMWGLDFHIREFRGSSAVLWLGLHPEEAAFQAQLKFMRAASSAGSRNFVLLERTGKPDIDSYRDFLALTADHVVNGILYLNSREAVRWDAIVRVPSTIARAPLPESFFEVGERRSRLDPRASRCVSVIFVGRLSRRKRTDKLLALWPAWRSSLGETGLRPSLQIYGRPFTAQPSEAPEKIPSPESEGVRWHHTFPGQKDICSWPARSVAVSMSSQEFDALALSELLACGLPVVASEASGHQALASESASVGICTADDHFIGKLREILSDPEVYRHLSNSGIRDMRCSRSMASVGHVLGRFLQSDGMCPSS